MSNPFNIQLGNDFPKAERKEAEALLNVFGTVMDAEMNLFKKAWSGWPVDDTAPKANRSDAVSQSLIDAALKYAFEDLYKSKH